MINTDVWIIVLFVVVIGVFRGVMTVVVQGIGVGVLADGLFGVHSHTGIIRSAIAILVSSF